MGAVDLRQVLFEMPAETASRDRMEDGPLACVESDRFCARCGYNLRTLPIPRDGRTKILLVRCTECGHYQPANDSAAVTRPWLAYLWLADDKKPPTPIRADRVAPSV